jgi:hypothetical protein
VLEPVFFGLGVANALALLVVFVLRAPRLDLVERFGWLYLLLAVPAVWALVLARQENAPVQYTVFLVIFLGFLVIEALYDWVLRVPFREKPDWRILAPYVALYVSSSYGFVVMTWKESVAAGAVVLVLTVAQVAANALTHTNSTGTAR